MAFEIAKAGWVQRQSKILRRWKKRWLVLYQDGNIRYFENPDSSVAEDCQLIPTKCLHIYTEEQMGDLRPPEGCGRSSLFSIVFQDKTWNLCAESPDDMRAWQAALQEARIVHRAAPPPYQQVVYPGPYDSPYQTFTYSHSYPGQVIYTTPDQYEQYVTPGQTTIIYTDNCHSCRGHCRGNCHHYYGSDMAMGMMGGMAMGSLMMAPILFW